MYPPFCKKDFKKRRFTAALFSVIPLAKQSLSAYQTQPQLRMFNDLQGQSPSITIKSSESRGEGQPLQRDIRTMSGW
jgi:hypothetical protein